ncbi:hypothetical protein [Lysobacter sp. CA199]|uniref:hypothetical protein n=1 Tax=Lysobacter sp. CA199 TaxID=3455608 RepID=UPI003F8D0F49
MTQNLWRTHADEIARELRRHRYERSDQGLLLTHMGVFVGGAMKVRDYRDGHYQSIAIDANTLLNEGLNHLLNVAYPPTGGYPQITQWYLAPFKGNYTPDPTLTAAQFPAAADEFTAYTATTRPAWVIPRAASAQSTGNTGNEALFVLAAGGPYNLYGCLIVSSSAKGSTTGVGTAAVRFDHPRLNMAGGDKLGIEYVLTATDAG